MTHTSDGYARHIDGLRAVSILLVLLFHFRVEAFAGGFVGVDVFFVVSGFLIIGLITRALERGDFTLLGFWSRRIRRLMPAIAFVLLLCLAAGFVLMTPGDFVNLARNALLSLVSAINFALLGDVGYFAESSVQNPLLHFWSLAVEEQFYLAFPPLAMALFALAGPARGRLVIAVALIVLGAASFIAGEALLRMGEKSIAYYMMPTRFGQLAFGGVLALWLIPREGPERLAQTPRWLADVMTIVAMAGLIACAVLYTSTTPFPGLAASPVTFAALVLLAFGGRGYLRSVLTNPIAVYVGRLSFVLYLLHWPAYSFYAYYVSRVPTPLETGCIAGAVFLLSAVLHHGLENPVRFARIFSGARMFFVVGPSIAATAVLATLVIAQDGMIERVPEARRAMVANAARFHESNFGGAGYQPATLQKLGDPQAEPEFILIGDSLAAQFAYGVDTTLRAQGRAALYYAFRACGYLTTHTYVSARGIDSECLASGQLALELARSQSLPIIFSRSWARYNQDIAQLADLEGHPIDVTADEYAAINANMLRALADANPARDRIVLLGANTGFIDALPPINCLARPDYLGLPCVRQSAFAAASFQPAPAEARLFETMRQDSRFQIVPMQEIYCTADLCSQIAPDGVVLFSDSGHLSRAGSLRLAPRMLGLAGLNPDCGEACDAGQPTGRNTQPAPTAAPAPQDTIQPTTTAFSLDLRGELAARRVSHPPSLQVRATQTGLVLTGHIPDASAQSQTGGVSVRIDPPHETAFAGRRIEVTLRARSRDGAAGFSAVYSTNDVGNSGWRPLPLTSEFAPQFFSYNVPPMQRGASDFIGIMPPTTGSVEIERVDVRIIE